MGSEDCAAIHEAFSTDIDDSQRLEKKRGRRGKGREILITDTAELVVLKTVNTAVTTSPGLTAIHG